MWGKLSLEEKEKWKDFIEKYNVDYIKNRMQIDDYITGKKSKTSFCYMVENGLMFLGSIRGARAFKFGVYYGITHDDPTPMYRYSKYFSDEDFQSVKNELINLINCTKKLKRFIDVESKFNGMFKYKIMYIYNPKIMLPIYSSDDLKDFSKKLGLVTSNSFEKNQHNLLEYRDRNHPKMDNMAFAAFLYKEYKYSKKVFDLNDKIDNALNDKVNTKNVTTVDTLAYVNKPIDKLDEKIDSSTKIKYYPRDDKMAQIALIKAQHKCEYDNEHYCFIRRKNDTPYTEVHHLIPLCFYSEFDNSLDVPANIVSLCSNCHNEIHYGKDWNKLVKKLFEERKDALEEAGIGIELEELLEKYEKICSKK